jgi:triosephosphate isomerase (TIM)
MPERRMLIAGNWKMNPRSAAEAAALAEALRTSVPIIDGVDVVACPPTIFLDLVRDALQGSGIAVGAQTMHWEEAGAFTGETSPAMLAGGPGDPIATYVILGHSERRQYDGETDEKVARKVSAALDYRLVPIAAIGETLEERQDGAAEAVIRRQLEAAISTVDTIAGRRLAIAYEPVWAIGTKMAASPADAQAAAGLIREILVAKLGDDANAVPILYGGSVTADNAAELFERNDIDGALVGGASLKPDVFAEIVRVAGTTIV